LEAQVMASSGKPQHLPEPKSPTHISRMSDH
jgi:hypothetical protein